MISPPNHMGVRVYAIFDGNRMILNAGQCSIYWKKSVAEAEALVFKGKGWRGLEVRAVFVVDWQAWISAPDRALGAEGEGK